LVNDSLPKSGKLFFNICMKRILLLLIAISILGNLFAQYRKQPYLLYTNNYETMKVVFQTHQPQVYLVSYGLTEKYEIGSAQISQLKDGKNENVFQYTFKYLKPLAKYYFRISDKNGNNVYKSSFFSGKKMNDKKVYFLVTGNSFSKRNYTDSIETAIIKFVNKEKKFNSILLHTGNIVRKGTKENGWKRLFDNELNEKSEERSNLLPIIATIGSNETNKPLFRKYFRYAYTSKTNCFYSCIHGNLKFIVLDQFTGFEDDSEQLSWLKNELVSDQKFNKVVLIHSISAESNKDRTQLHALFEEYNVKLVFCNQTLQGETYKQVKNIHYFSSENKFELRRKSRVRNSFLAVKYEGNNVSVSRLDKNLKVIELFNTMIKN